MLEFPIRLHYKDLDQKILLKVDTGSNINCISLGTFQRLFPNQQLDRAMLKLENYSNSLVSIIGRFKAFIQWKGKIFHQGFHVINANYSLNLLSRDASFRMEVLQTCFTVTGKELPHLSQTKQGKHSIDSSVRKSPRTMHKHPSDSSVRKSPLTMHSINPKSVSKSPLTEEKILEVHADVFKGIGTFPGESYRFSLKENYVPARHALRKAPIHLQEDFYQKYMILSSKVY